jgi:hypothetical protein
MSPVRKILRRELLKRPFISETKGIYYSSVDNIWYNFGFRRYREYRTSEAQSS